VITNVNTPITATFKRLIFATNAGGSQYTASDGTLYQADTRFTGGTTSTTTVAIAGTQDDRLYQSERAGSADFSYNIPVAAGNYVVILKFAETDWSQAGRRIFDVYMEGTQVITNLDIFARVGRNKAYDVTVPVRITDGVLNIRFHPDTHKAKVNAIKIMVN
jgi:hypothetical protein